MKLNTYGLKIKKADVILAARETRANLPKVYAQYNTVYMPLYYDVSTGEVWLGYFNDFGGSKKIYHDKTIKHIATYRQQRRAQDIINDIYAFINFGEYYYENDNYYDWLKERGGKKNG